MGYLDTLVRKSKGEPEEKPTVSPPSDVKETVEPELPAEKKLIEEYGICKIYKLPAGDKLYAVPVPKPTGPERKILDTVKEAATRLITVTPDEIKDVNERKQFFKKRILEIIDASPELGIPPAKIDFYADTIMHEMIGYGPLDLLLQDDRLEEIMVIGPFKPVYIFHRDYEMMKTNIIFGRDDDILAIIDRIARDVGRRIDVKEPLLDARLPDGSRVNATIPPISLEGSTITIRKFREDPFTVVDLIKFGTMNSELSAFLWLAVEGMKAKPANILVSGGTGSGKTTTLNVLAAFIPRNERIVSMEDSVAGDEEIILFKDGNVIRKQIGEFVDCIIKNKKIKKTPFGHEIVNLNGFETLAFDRDGKIIKTKIGSIIRHKTNKQMYEIILRSGRRIKVTEDHNLFTLDEGGNISPIPTSELSKDSFIAVPRVGREYDAAWLKKLSNSDIFWDRVKEIKIIPQKEKYVYDMSVPNYENFWCSNVFVHNTAELKIPVEHWVRLETRPPGIEGTGEIDMDTLVKNSLRMRPDRIVLGEIRGKEAFTLFTAMNTGHSGCQGTVHANDARETLVRLTSPPMTVPDLMLSALNFIVVEQKIHDRRKGTIRRITEVAELTGVLEGKPQLVFLYEWDAATDTIKSTGVPSRYLQELGRYTGLSHTDIQKEIERRKKFLEGLVEKNVRGIVDVCNGIHEFIA